MPRSLSRPSDAWIAPLLSRLFTTSSLLSLARVAGALAGFITQIVLARTLHASALGVFYSVTSLAPSWV